MNQFRLGQCLGTVSSASFRRSHNESTIDSLVHQKNITFAWARTQPGEDQQDVSSGSAGLPPYIAHQAGVNCLAIDQVEGRYLFSGGADSSIRVWDLEEHVLHEGEESSSTSTSLTSITKYTPETNPHQVHTILPYPLSNLPLNLPIRPYPSTLLSTSLAGPNGAIYTTAWSPKVSHILASGSIDGRVLFFDIRRANAAFASLDLDDAIGVIGTNSTTGLGARRDLLDFNAVAHNGPVTSIQWNSPGDKIITSGHDQRIRVWDAASGRNDLVHFGPRIRNERQGELKPLISPRGHHHVGQESLWWPNDDGKGMIFQHQLREGQLLRILRTEGIKIADVQQKARRGRGGGAGGSNLGRMTTGGRINAMVWRVNAPVGEGVEMYTAHGDGRICAWLPSYETEGEDEQEDERKDYVAEPESKVRDETPASVVNEAEQRRKRKRDMLEDMLGGLARQPMSFS